MIDVIMVVDFQDRPASRTMEERNAPDDNGRSTRSWAADSASSDGGSGSAAAINPQHGHQWHKGHRRPGTGRSARSATCLRLGPIGQLLAGLAGLTSPGARNLHAPTAGPASAIADG
jgi:hypothetical protein